MYPPGYPALTGKEGIPLDLFLTDSLSAHRSFACRAAGYPFIQGDRDQIGDVLPYRETSALGVVEKPYHGMLTKLSCRDKEL